jgi:hypothetical protein
VISTQLIQRTSTKLHVGLQVSRRSHRHPLTPCLGSVNNTSYTFSRDLTYTTPQQQTFYHEKYSQDITEKHIIMAQSQQPHNPYVNGMFTSFLSALKLIQYNPRCLRPWPSKPSKYVWHSTLRSSQGVYLIVN